LWVLEVVLTEGWQIDRESGVILEMKHGIDWGKVKGIVEEFVEETACCMWVV
jgi:hypothetical protein